MRFVVLCLLLVACSEKKRDEPPPVVKPAGPPPSCVEFEKLLAHLETCADKEDSSYVDIPMTKSSLRMNRDTDPTRLATFCTDGMRRFRESFPRCVTAEARGSAAAAPIEAVPLEPSMLGKTPAPFGRLAFLRAGITRHQILDELGLRGPRGGSIPVELGILGIGARIDIDFASTFDVVKLTVPSDMRDVLVKAWGEPTRTTSRATTWLDPAKRWRADLGSELMIGPYVPFEELLGAGADGLAETTTLIGLTEGALTTKYGARFNRTEILMPATDVCAYYTKLYVDFDPDRSRVTKLRFEQCYDDGAGADLVLAAMQKHWGKPTPVQRAGKLAGITFTRPGRSLEVSFDARIVTTITATAER
ncbi:MAG: hypothetical protein M4D80_30065 [Myxococcota bacterium]|nr:hypothetical protein [Myxococcota bacterium]